MYGNEEHNSQQIPKTLVLSSLSANNFGRVTETSLFLRGHAPILGDCTPTSVVVLQDVGFVFRDLRNRRDRVAAGLIGSASLQLAQ